MIDLFYDCDFVNSNDKYYLMLELSSIKVWNLLQRNWSELTTAYESIWTILF